MIRLYLHYYHVDSSGKYHANIMYEYNFRLYYTTTNKTTTKYNNCITIIISYHICVYLGCKCNVKLA